MRVALNRQRAFEEVQGTVRWLRPEFQNPPQPASESLSKTELLTHIPRGLQADLIPKAPEMLGRVQFNESGDTGMALRGGHHYNDFFST